MQLLINIDVPDLDAAVEFYSKGMGLKQERRLFGGSVAEMAGAPAPIYLLEKDSGTPASTGSSHLRDYRRHWTPAHLDFVVDDLDAALANALVAGAKLEGAVAIFRWGRQAVMSDPFGNGLCLVQWLNRGYDEEAD
ncbi:MAG TPA: VOC family protein [Burkholderiales bacterium]